MSGRRTANREGSDAVLVGPRRPPLAAARAISRTALARFSLDSYLRSPEASDSVVLCPQGRSVAADLAFLEAAKRRLLWPAPPEDIADAIAGLRTEQEPAHAFEAARRPSRPRDRGPVHAGLLLEGLVTRERAAGALASPLRLWIVESVRSVRLDEAELEALARKGVRWAALRPVVLAGLIVSAALARRRAGWPRWLKGCPVWRVPGTDAKTRSP